jgi:hypothetical protein
MFEFHKIATEYLRILLTLEGLKIDTGVVCSRTIASTSIDTLSTMPSFDSAIFIEV